jgi:hypothetical protein
MDDIVNAVQNVLGPNVQLLLDGVRELPRAQLIGIGKMKRGDGGGSNDEGKWLCCCSEEEISQNTFVSMIYDVPHTSNEALIHDLHDTLPTQPPPSIPFPMQALVLLFLSSQ